MTCGALTQCPTCGTHLGGIATFCWSCQEYVDDMLGATTDSTPANRPAPVKDTRSEDQRKADALPAITALGWVVLDFEQGYRPDDCPKCKTRLPGGHSTRVPSGIGDQLCHLGHTAAWLEWKTDKNKPTESQEEFGARCEREGIPYAVVRNTREAIDFLRGLRSAA